MQEVVGELKIFFEKLDADALRFRRPQKSIFFCGGAVSEDSKECISLRQYLVEKQRIEERFQAKIVRAESASDLYRDTAYKDLISFEEDIAKLSAIVLLIAESPGSLAELGAFCSSETIRPALVLLVQEDYENVRSFVRDGPIEKVINLKKNQVGFFPWKMYGNGKRIIKSSVSEHDETIIDFVRKQVERADKTTTLKKNQPLKEFAYILWIIFTFKAVGFEQIKDFLGAAEINLSEGELRNRLFCLRVVGWIDQRSYSNFQYYFSKYDVDPIDYTYKDSKSKDSLRAKQRLSEIFRTAAKIPDTVYKAALSAREEVIE